MGTCTGPLKAAGTSGCGIIYKLTTQGSLLYTYSFPCNGGGHGANAPLIQASDGNFYGVTSGNCGSSCPYYGTIYRMTPAGAVSTIHNSAINTRP